MGDDVDELTAAHGIDNDGAMGAEPRSAVHRRQTARDGVDRDEAAPADLAGEARRVRAEEACSHGGVDAVGADNDVGLDIATVVEMRDGAVGHVLDAGAARAEVNDLGRQRGAEDVEQVGAMHGAAAGAVALRGALALGSSR